MTESEWLACTDPTPMLTCLCGKASDRKLRLFSVACCRRIWHLLPDELTQIAVTVAEDFADKKATKDLLEAALSTATDSMADPTAVDFAAADYGRVTSLSAALCTCQYAAWAAANGSIRKYRKSYRGNEELVAQARMLRCIFGYPFRPLTICPSWLTWNDSAILKLAQAIYDARAFDRLPQLADALEDAGCTDAAILAHCREAGPHVRGCWVVDLLLGRN